MNEGSPSSTPPAPARPPSIPLPPTHSNFLSLPLSFFVDIIDAGKELTRCPEYYTGISSLSEEAITAIQKNRSPHTARAKEEGGRGGEEGGKKAKTGGANDCCKLP